MLYYYREDIIIKIIATSPKEGPNEPHTCTIPICPSCLVIKENTSVHCSVSNLLLSTTIIYYYYLLYIHFFY